MPKYTINGKEVNENDFWTQNSTVVVSFAPEINEKNTYVIKGKKDAIINLSDGTWSKVNNGECFYELSNSEADYLKDINKHLIFEIKSPNTEGHSTRHKAAGIRSITDELNKSKNEKTYLQILKESYLEYFKNDTWAKSKIVAVQTVQELSIAIEQITGRESLIIKQQEISKEDIDKAGGIHKFFEDFVKEVLEEDLKKQDKGAPSQIIMDEFATGFNPFVWKKESEGVKHSKGKLKMELDFDFIKQMAERMSSNKKNGKYQPFNWKLKMNSQELAEALMRHCIEVIEGRYEDDGREYGHLEALSTGAMMLNYQLKNFPQNKK